MNIPTYPAPARTLATLEIINDNFPAGTLGFSATNYSVVESAGYVTITVLRTNGSTGVGYGQLSNPERLHQRSRRANGRRGTAITRITSGTLTFGDGVTSTSFNVPITNFSTPAIQQVLQRSFVQPDRRGRL